jgi:hypothetical protein
MAGREAQIPGGPYLNDAEESVLYQRMALGSVYINETEQSGTMDAPTMMAGFGRRKMVRIFRGG